MRHAHDAAITGRSGRRRKILDAGELQLVTLHLLAAQPRHGYEIIREVETLSGGAYAPSPGMVYPNLSLLLELGHIEEIGAEGGRKNFAITAEGRANLGDNGETLDTALSRLTTLADASNRADIQPLRRAMGNLREVLIAATDKPDFDDGKIRDAARMIDELAGTIERM